MSLYCTEVECPTCRAPVAERCRSLSTRRITDTHVARREAAYVAASLPTSGAKRDAGGAA
jgi:hypothetical protein